MRGEAGAIGVLVPDLSNPYFPDVLTSVPVERRQPGRQHRRRGEHPPRVQGDRPRVQGDPPRVQGDRPRASPVASPHRAHRAPGARPAGPPPPRAGAVVPLSTRSTMASHPRDPAPQDGPPGESVSVHGVAARAAGYSGDGGPPAL